ncbi:MAG: phosphoribosylglycinamide formyltransferase [Bacteroidales bacterium]
MRFLSIFASGSGTNAENIIRYFSKNKTAKVNLLLSDNSSSMALKRAHRLGVEAHVFSMDNLKSGQVCKFLIDKKTDFIILAGFLKLIPENLLEAFPDRILNIHPALLPKFGGKGMYGMNVHRAAIEAGEHESGITVHLVNKKYDEGKILFQQKCPILPNDNPETLAERIHQLEYEFYPQVIDNYINKQK